MQHLLLDLQVGQAAECAASFSRSSSALLRMRVEIVAEHLQRDLGADAGQHVIEPMRDRLADIDRQRQHRQAVSGCRRRSRSSARLDGLRSISSSLTWTPSACSSSSARPVRRPTDFTSGTSSISRSAMVPTRFDSASETPGIELTRMVKVPSLNGGRNARGNVKAAIAAAAITSTSVTPRIDAAVADRRASSAAPIAALQHAHQAALVLVQALQARQHVIGHHRRQRDRHDEARQDRNDVGLARAARTAGPRCRTARTAARTPAR